MFLTVAFLRNPHNNEPPVSDAKNSIVSAPGTSRLPSEKYEGQPCFSSTLPSLLSNDFWLAIKQTFTISHGIAFTPILI